MSKAIILLSGGLDSATCLAIASKKGHECYTISFDYGQKSKVEIESAEIISKSMNAKRHETVKISIGNLLSSALTNKSIDIPKHKHSNPGEIPTTYVPARNTIFLSIALGWAEVLNADCIYIGVSNVDYSGYPDCRPEFIDAFQNLIGLATKSGINNQTIKIETPLINLSKSETIKLGNSIGVDYSLTLSCYSADNEGRACGFCDSCVLRKKGFAEALVPDPTKYI